MKTHGFAVSGMAWRRMVLLAVALLMLREPSASRAAAETVVIGARTPWRVHFVVGRNIYRGQDKNQLMITHGNGGRVPYDADMKRFSPMPPKGWTQPRFDDACWARYTPDDLVDFLGDYAAPAADWRG